MGGVKMKTRFDEYVENLTERDLIDMMIFNCEDCPVEDCPTYDVGYECEKELERWFKQPV